MYLQGDGTNLYQYALNDPVNWLDPNGLWGVYAAGTGDVVGGYDFSVSGGGYLGTEGAGTFNGASANVGFEVGLEAEFGGYTGDAPPQVGEDYWGFDVDFGFLGIQANIGPCGSAVGVTVGPGTPGFTVNPGGSNVSL